MHAKCFTGSAGHDLETLTRHWPHSRNVRRGAGRTLGPAEAALTAVLDRQTSEQVTTPSAKSLAGTAGRALELLTRHWPHSQNVRRGAGRTLGPADAALAAVLDRPTSEQVTTPSAKSLAGSAGRTLELLTRHWPYSQNVRRGAGRTLGQADAALTAVLDRPIIEQVTTPSAKSLAESAGCDVELLTRHWPHSRNVQRRWPHSWTGRRDADRNFEPADKRAGDDVER